MERPTQHARVSNPSPDGGFLAGLVEQNLALRAVGTGGTGTVVEENDTQRNVLDNTIKGGLKSTDRTLFLGTISTVRVKLEALMRPQNDEALFVAPDIESIVGAVVDSLMKNPLLAGMIREEESSYSLRFAEKDLPIWLISAIASIAKMIGLALHSDLVLELVSSASCVAEREKRAEAEAREEAESEERVFKLLKLSKKLQISVLLLVSQILSNNSDNKSKNFVH